VALMEYVGVLHIMYIYWRMRFGSERWHRWLRAVLCGWRREQAPAVSSDEARELYLKLSVTFVYIVRFYRSNFAGAG